MCYLDSGYAKSFDEKTWDVFLSKQLQVNDRNTAIQQIVSPLFKMEHGGKQNHACPHISYYCNDINLAPFKAVPMGSLDAFLDTAKTAPTFQSVTRYLSNCAEVLCKAENRVIEGAALCLSLDKGDWPAILAQYQKAADYLPVDGLKLFHDGLITVEQFSTLLFFWSLITEFPEEEIHIQPLFDGAKINAFAEASIRNTLKLRGFRIHKDQFLNHESLKIFFNKMRLQKQSERCFFFIKTTKYTLSPYNREKDRKVQDGTLTINEETSAGIGVNVFHQFFSEYKGYYRMVPSFSMMQQFLVAHDGDRAVKILPVIGPSSTEDIANNGANDSRDMGLPFLGMELPKKADMLAAPKAVDFIFHDFYHSIVASDVSRKFRKAFVIYARAIQEIKKHYAAPLVIRFLDEYYERIIDMEYPEFGKKWKLVMSVKNPTEAQRFLSSVVEQIANAFKRFLSSISNNKDDPYRHLGTMPKLGATLRYLVVTEKVLDKLVDILHRDKFCERFGITKEDCEPLIMAYNKNAEKMENQIDSYYSLPKKAIHKSLFEEIEQGSEKMTALDGLKRLESYVDNENLILLLKNRVWA